MQRIWYYSKPLSTAGVLQVQKTRWWNHENMHHYVHSTYPYVLSHQTLIHFNFVYEDLQSRRRPITTNPN